MKKVDEIFIYPTDTVWGIGGNIFSKDIYDQIAIIKKTRFDKPLTIMFSDLRDFYLWFHFPIELQENTEFFKSFFLLETTIGIPREWLRKEVPYWIHQGSPYISVRCLENCIVKEIWKITQSPIFTTSLNLTGHPPITNRKAALDFKAVYAPNAQVINFGENSLDEFQLSGAPSTTISINLKANGWNFGVWRKGKRWNEINDFLLKNFPNVMIIQNESE